MLRERRGVVLDIETRDRAWLRVSHDIAYSNHKRSRETEHLHVFVPHAGSLPPFFAWLVEAPYSISGFDADPHCHPRNV